MFAILLKFIPQRFLLWLVLGAGLSQILVFAGIRVAALQESAALTQWLLSDQSQYRLLINWLFYFIFGLFVGQLNLEWLKARRWMPVTLATGILAGFSWIIYDSWKIIETTGNIIYATSFTRLPILLYATFVVLAVLLYGANLAQKKQFHLQIFQTLGKYSYAIYLSHTLALRILKGVITNEPRVSTLTLAGTLFVAGTLLSGRLSSG